MQRKVPMPALWDAEFPKQRMQATMERAKYAQSERDWRTAQIYVERVIADIFDRYHFCALSRCRRARRCIGNPPLCWSRPSASCASPQRCRTRSRKAMP